jgi:NADH:ubiquinone oxidoreductase subunit F (NADH-binding)/NAD-dependent dihydropyrimidine dehydrogenase PreA subunit/(2Fe-2S) ferredoxin
MLTLQNEYNLRCCDRCHHSADKPCPQFIHCITDGPLCHEDEKCKKLRQDRLSTIRRERLTKPVIYIGAATCGLAAGADEVIPATKEYLKAKGIDAEIVEVGCIGYCAKEPIVDVQLPGKTRVSYMQVTADVLPKVLDTAFAGQVEKEYLLGQFPSEVLENYANTPSIFEHPFFIKQKRWVLENCGIIDPTSINEYIARGGYRSLASVVRDHTPAEICDNIEKSGLRGRGGGGFPTGKKWKFALAAVGKQKYVVCNADEGDPGAFMDRAVIEGDPHRVLEGLAIAAYAIGSDHAYVYVRAEYPLAIKRLIAAIKQARDWGLIGRNILDSGFNLEITIKKGAGAFVCGEETALLGSIEGRRGMPRPRPPFPANKGLFGCPTVINNVETLANIPNIIRTGWEAFAALGTQNSKGTKVFALSGKVVNTGLVEVVMGTSIREVIFDIGGGIANGKKYKGVQIGGPSGGCIPTNHLDTPVDYESLKTVGAIMGSGGLVVMDEDTCMVDMAKFFMQFIQRESCGKCIPCREGTRRMLEILNRITRSHRGENAQQALERFQSIIYLDRLANVIKDTSLCGLGQTAPNPVLSTLQHFRDEYEAHVFERKCPSGACGDLLSYKIDATKCKGCRLCAKNCPSGAIMGAPKSPHYIVEDKCIGCGNCLQMCKFGAVVKE